MSEAFRDEGALHELVRRLEEENADLKREIGRLRSAEVERAAELPNREAFVKRLSEECEELRKERDEARAERDEMRPHVRRGLGGYEPKRREPEALGLLSNAVEKIFKGR